MNKENCALKLVDELILYYDAQSKKHQATKNGNFLDFTVILNGHFRNVMSKSPCIFWQNSIPHFNVCKSMLLSDLGFNYTHSMSVQKGRNTRNGDVRDLEQVDKYIFVDRENLWILMLENYFLCNLRKIHWHHLPARWVTIFWVMCGIHLTS